MDYSPSDSSGTDDDLPATYQNKGRDGQMNGNGRSAAVGRLPLDRVQSDFESQIHLLSREAYFSVLRAFRAQAEALSWEKAGLICELRKELKVSDDEHRELLSLVNTNDTLCRIREWREAGGAESAVINNICSAQDPRQSLSVSTFHKKQKMELPEFGSSMQPSSYAAKLDDLSPRIRGRKTKMGRAFSGCDPGKVASIDPLVGEKVRIRWPEDNNFYEAVITDYNPSEGMHAVVYDMNTPDETWEWVNLSQIPPDDILMGGGYPGFALRSGRRGSGRGTKKGMRRVSGGGRGRRAPRDVTRRNDFRQQNGAFRGLSGEITILNTDNLIEEVEKIFSSSNWDPDAVEKAKQALMDHEQSLMNVLARLADASDSESDGDDRQQRDQHEQSDGDEDQMIEI